MKSDLGQDELERLATKLPESFAARRMAEELVRRRRDATVDRERVQTAVSRIASDVLADAEPRWSVTTHRRVVELVAGRVAETLVTHHVARSAAAIDYVLGESGFGPDRRAEVRAEAMRFVEPRVAATADDDA